MLSALRAGQGRRLYRSSTTLVAALLIFVAVAVSLLPGNVVLSQQSSSNPERPEITEEDCSFWIDSDADGEGNIRIEPEPDQLVHQDSPVVGGCTFKLSAPKEATMEIESELVEWEVNVEIKREPDTSNEFTLYLGDTRIPDIEGDMRVVINFSDGHTPRSIRSRTLPDRYRHDAYRHDVQIPEAFRLLGVTVITSDGLKDRLEQDVQSASDAYISTRQRIAESGAELPEWAVTLATDWLEKGYPQVADEIIFAARGHSGIGSGSGGINWWMWLAIVTWIILIVAGAMMFYLNVIKPNRPNSKPEPLPDADM